MEKREEKHKEIHGKFALIMPSGGEEQFPHRANVFTRELVASCFRAYVILQMYIVDLFIYLILFIGRVVGGLIPLTNI